MTETTSSSEARRDGRLEDPDVELRTDPRLHPGLLADLAALGLDGRAAPPPFDRSAGLEAIAEFLGGAHAGFTQVYEAVPSAWPDEQPASVDYRSEAITGPGGNEIKLHIHRPADTAGVLPCVVHIHGGGMTILDTDHPVFRRWNTDLAAAGLVTVSVGFRNAWTPGGLFSVVPYISGGYGWDISRKLRELPSLVENDGHFLNVPMMDLLVAAYDPTSENAENPLCWPYFATESDVAGLPPHVITVNELDPLRDEGIAYFRTLLRGGVRAVGRVNLGMVHAAEVSFRQSVADAYRAAVREVSGFAASL